MLSIAVCDDSTVQAQRLMEMIRVILEPSCLRTDIYSTADDLLRALADARYDVILMDIVLGEGNGIETAKLINIRDPRTQIIFMTSFLQYSADISEAKFAYFLTKPITEEKLSLALRRAASNIRRKAETPVIINLRKDIVRLLPSEIIFCERIKRTTTIHCADMHFDTSLKLSDIESILPDGCFARPHNSYIVNLNAIRRLGRTSVEMKTGQAIPVSRRNSTEFREAFFAALGRKDNGE